MPHTVHVSPHGNDTNTGTTPFTQDSDTNGPLQSLQAALEKARVLRDAAEKKSDVPADDQDSPHPDTLRDEVVHIVLHEGHYHLPQPLALGPEDSHTHFHAHEGAHPVIDAGLPLPAFTEEIRDDTTVWTADVSGIIDRIGYFHQLFVNDRRAPRARLPKKDYYWMEDVPGTVLGKTGYRSKKVQKHRFIAREGDFKAFRNITDCNVVVLHWWSEDRRAVASFDPATREVRLAEDTVFILVDDNTPVYARYYIDNVFEGLSEPGEWYCDRTHKKLYYLPREGESLDTVRAYAAGHTHILSLTGEPDQRRFVTDVQFHGISFLHSDWRDYNRQSQAANRLPGAIRLHGVRECGFVNCRIAHCGDYGIDITHGSKRCLISGCELFDLGAGAIKINGSNAYGSRLQRTGEITVSDNHCHALGRVHHGAGGMCIKHAFNTRVVHNHIHDCFYTAISCGWVWGYWESVTRNMRIEKNLIHDVGQGLLNDMGAIYLLGVQPGTAIRNNVIHTVTSRKYGGWAIYLDEGASHIVIENNICYDTTSQAFHIHFGNENIVRNNIWAFSGEGIFSLERGPQCVWPKKGLLNDGCTVNTVTAERNIFITDNTPVYLGGMAREINADASSELQNHPLISECNLFYDVGGNDIYQANGGHKIAREGYRDLFTWQQWQAMGYDRFSMIADPKCHCPKEGDFTLAADSPALALGFRPIDTADLGPRPVPTRDVTIPDGFMDPEIKY
jgi:hypothetical protein